MPPTESIVATSSMLICHYWSPYLSKREIVLEAQLTGLGLWKIKYRRISTIRIMTMTRTGSSILDQSQVFHKKCIIRLHQKFELQPKLSLRGQLGGLNIIKKYNGLNAAYVYHPFSRCQMVYRCGLRLL
jgi:hypothetical protein